MHPLTLRAAQDAITMAHTAGIALGVFCGFVLAVAVIFVIDHVRNRE